MFIKLILLTLAVVVLFSVTLVGSFYGFQTFHDLSSQLMIYDLYSTCNEMNVILNNTGMDRSNLSMMGNDKFDQNSKFNQHDQDVIQHCIQGELPILSSYQLPKKIGFLNGVNGHDAKGKFEIILIGQNEFLRLENFEIGYEPRYQSGFKIPELHIYLSRDDDLSSDDIHLDKLKKNLGDKNYPLLIHSSQYNEEYDTILIYDVIHKEIFATAKLNDLSPISDSFYNVMNSIKSIDYHTKIESEIINEQYGFLEGSDIYKAKGSMNTSFEEDEGTLQSGSFEISKGRDPELYLTTNGNVRKSNHWTFGPDGNIYVASGNTNEILRYDAASGKFLNVFIQKGSGGLDGPRDLVFSPDGKYLLVTSFFNNQVLKYDAASGKFLNVFIQKGSGGLDGPRDLVFSPDGNIYVASGNTNEILRYDENTGDYLGVFVSEDIGGMDFPMGLAIGPDSNLYVVSNENDKVLRYSLDGKFQNVFVSGPELYSPTDLAFDENFLYVSSDKTDEILKYDAITGDFINSFITKTTDHLKYSMSDIDHLKSPTGILVGPNGNIYVASDGTNEILKYDPVRGKLFDDEKFIGDKSNGLSRPGHLEIKDGKICVSNNFNNSINCYDEQTGKNLDKYMISLRNTIAYRDNSVTGPDGELYMSNNLANEIVQFDGTDSKLILQTGDSLLRTPSYLTFHDGYLYVGSDDKIFKFDEKGDFIDIFVTTNTGSLRNPQGLLFTDDELIVNSYNDRMLRYDLNGKFIGEFTSSKNDLMVKPIGMAVDKQGNLFTTTQLGQILQYSSNGDLINTIEIPESNCIDHETLSSDPHGILLNGNELYVAVFNQNALMVYDLTVEKFTKIYCDDLLVNPEGLALGNDILYISVYGADSIFGMSNIVEFDLRNHTFSPLSINSGDGRLSLPRGLFFYNGYLYIANSNNNEILQYDPDNTSLNIITNFVGNSIKTGGITFGPSDNLFIINENNNDIYEYDLDDGNFMGVFVEFVNSLSVNFNADSINQHDLDGLLESFNDDILILQNITFSHDNKFLFASVPSNDGILVYDSHGKLHDVFVDSDVLEYPTDITLTPDGNHLLVSNYGANTISRLSISDGFLDVEDPIFISPGNDGLIEITQIGFDPFDNLYVVGGKYNHILKYTSDGKYLGEFDVDNIYLNRFSENLLRHYTLNGIDTNRNNVLVVYDNFLEQSVATLTLNNSVEFLTPLTIFAYDSLSPLNLIENPELKSKDVFKRTGFFIGNDGNAYGQAIIKNVDQQVLVKIETFAIDYDKSNYLSVFPYFDYGIPEPTVCLSVNFDDCNVSNINKLKVNAGDNVYLLHDVDTDSLTSDDLDIFIYDDDNLLAHIPLREYGIARISLNSFIDWIQYYLPVFPFIGLMMLFPIMVDYTRSLFKLIFFSIYWLQGTKSVIMTGKNEKVTILIPAHNEEYGIGEAIESALATDYPNKEIIVIDDGSDDDTYLIAYKFAEKGLIKLVHRDTASGSKATALNYGANYATGEYIICMDGDTKLDKDALKNAVNYFDDDVVALSGNVKIIAGDNGITNTVTRLQSYEYMVAIELGRRFTSFFKILLVISGAFGVFKKSFFKGVHTFDNDTLTEDFDLTLKLRKTKKKILFVADSIAYTYCPNNLSAWKKQRNRWAYGQFQTLLKNRNIITSKFSIRDKISFLDMFVLDIFLALTFAVGLVVLVIIAMILYLQDNLPMLIYPLVFTMLSFMVLESLIFLYAVAHSGKNKLSSLKLVYLSPIMTFYYRPYLKLINLRAYINAYFKKQTSW